MSASALANTPHDEIEDMWDTIHVSYEWIVDDDPRVYLGEIVPYDPGLVALQSEASDACISLIHGDDGPDGHSSGPGRYADLPPDDRADPLRVERIRSTYSLLRAFRDALWEAAREQLTGTAFAYDPGPDHDPGALGEAGGRLFDDYLNLANASRRLGQELYKDRSSIDQLWESSGATAHAHAAMRSIARFLGSDGTGGERRDQGALVSIPFSSEFRRIPEEIGRAMAALTAVREGLLGIIHRDIHISLPDHDPGPMAWD
jgi:hypothetical protein